MPFNLPTRRLRMLALPDGRASPGGGDAGAGSRPAEEVTAPWWRSFTADFKREVLVEVDAAGPGEVGAILRIRPADVALRDGSLASILGGCVDRTERSGRASSLSWRVAA